MNVTVYHTSDAVNYSRLDALLAAIDRRSEARRVLSNSSYFAVIHQLFFTYAYSLALAFLFIGQIVGR